MKQLDAISRDVKDEKIKDTEFQFALESLYRKVDLPGLLKTLDFDRIARGVKYKDRGETSLSVDFKNVAGLPTKLVWGRQIFAMKKGRSVVPHGHDKMATGFLVLNGKLHGRHFDRVEDRDDHYLIRPTIDRTFVPGEFSTVSDHKDNVHWFTAETDDAFLFNRPRHRHQFGKHQRVGPGLRRSDGREVGRGIDQGPQDHPHRGQPALRLIDARQRVATLVGKG